jgi:capsular polysaccharide biosynthesis protein
MDLARFVSIVLRSIRLIVVMTVMAAVAAFIISQNLPKKYQSEARVLVGSVTDPNIDLLNAYEQLAQTYAELATTTPTLTRVSDQLGLNEDPTRLALAIDVRAPAGESIVQIVATGASPAQAAAIANAVAQQLTDLGRTATSGVSIASVVQPALPDPNPSSPLILLNTLIVSVLGFALGVGIAFLLAIRRDGTTPLTGSPAQSVQDGSDSYQVVVVKRNAPNGP